MDFQPERIRLADDSNRNVIRTILSAIKLGLLKFLDAIIYFFGISKSILYFLLFRGNNRRGSSSNLNKCSRVLYGKNIRKMNFSSLKRRLFDKRGKKKSKSECSVYILDSPPDLAQKKCIHSEHVLDLPKKTSTNLSDNDFEIGLMKVANFEVVADVHRDYERGETELKLNDIGNGDFENKHAKGGKTTPASNCQKLQKRVSPMFCVQKPVDGKTKPTAKNGICKTTEGNQGIDSAKIVSAPKEDASFEDIVNKLSYVKIKQVTAQNRETTVIENVRELEKLKNELKYLPVNKESPQKSNYPFGKQTKIIDDTKSESENSASFKTQLKYDIDSQNGESPIKIIKTTSVFQKSSRHNYSHTETSVITTKSNASCEKENPSKPSSKTTDKPDASKENVKSTAELQSLCHEDLSRNTETNNSGNCKPSCDKGPAVNESIESSTQNKSPSTRDNRLSIRQAIKTVDFLDLDYDLVAVAFKHSIIPEKLQATGEDLEILIQKCFIYALKREREKTDVTDPVDAVSPLLEELTSRENERDKKLPPKKAIAKVAFEAAYIQHECDKMIQSCSQMNLPSKRSLKLKDVESLTSILATVKESYSVIAKYFQRLKQYSRNSDKLVPLIIYRTPVCDHLDDTMSDIMDVLTNYKKVMKYINNKIETLEEARKKSELVNTMESETRAQSVVRNDCIQNTNIETSIPTNNKVSTDKQVNRSLDLEKESTKELPQSPSSNVEPQTTNTSRKKSWKANRASELRCAVSSSNGQTSKRIIAPINDSLSRGFDHGKQSNEAKANDDKNSSPKETTSVSTNYKTNETSRGLGNKPNAGENENSERATNVSDETRKNTREAVYNETGGGDGLNVSSITAGIATSTPKKNAKTNHGNTPNKCPNAVSRRMLIGREKANVKKEAIVTKATTDFDDEDEEIVSSFCDGGEGCLDEVDVDNINDEDVSSKDDTDNYPKAKDSVLVQNAAVMIDIMNKSVQCDVILNNSLNSTYGSNMTGNISRDFSDLSKSFTSYIETNNTIDFSSLEVKPSHGDRVNKKKLQAEIKPKKKKTRGIPNQHLEPKSIPKVKVEVNCGVGDDFTKDKSETETAPNNVGFVDEILDKEEQKAKTNRSEHSEIQPNQGEFVQKPMNYEHWQTIDQREILMVPDQVHYQGESKLKDVEDMYTVARAKGKKKKKKKEKKAKTKQRDDGTKHSDDEFFM